MLQPAFHAHAVRHAPNVCHAPHRRAQCIKILLTGTPVQNRVEELFSLCNFVMPSVFSRRDEFLQIYRCVATMTMGGQGSACVIVQ